MALIAGVDEAGRGALAGPVTAAAVILPPDHQIVGLKDSKKLSPKRRAILFDEIQAQAVSIGVGIVDARQIDKLNILRATQKAMQIALGRLSEKPDKALIDGFGLPNQIIPNVGMLKGDNLIDEIKAASIIAKVTRDRLMIHYDVVFPEYGFAKHKGYGTKMHFETLATWKAIPIHRKTFKPVSLQLPSLGWYRKRKRIGWLGERLAALKLIDKEYYIKAMNVHCSPYGEIDIIAEKNDEIVFVEVKTISKEQMGVPELKVDTSKLSRLEKAIECYLTEHEITNDIRLDVMTVVLRKGQVRIAHFKGIELD